MKATTSSKSIFEQKSQEIFDLRKKKKKATCCEKFKKKGKFCKSCPCSWA